MLGGDENKPMGKSGQRKRGTGREGKKAEPRRRQSAQPQEPQQDQLQEDQLRVVPEAVDVPLQVTSEAVSVPSEVAPEVTSAPSEVAPELVRAPIVPTGGASLAVVSPVDSAPVIAPVLPVPLAETLPVTSAEAEPVRYQTIASAYCNYTLQSLDRTRSYLERLAAVRSPDKALELQSEFAKQAYEGFVTESQRICELHSKLAQERLKRWEDFVARMMPSSRSLPH